jgi:hypothetical protein
VAGERLTRDVIEEEGVVSPIFEPDPLVQELSGVSVVALDGYLGEVTGDEPNRVQRLYHDASYTFWVEIHEANLLAQRRLTRPGFPDASVVWVTRGATLIPRAEPEEEPLPDEITPEDLLTVGDPPLWADVRRVTVEREGQEG